jgi:hypothetical protein
MIAKRQDGKPILCDFHNSFLYEKEYVDKETGETKKYSYHICYRYSGEMLESALCYGHGVNGSKWKEAYLPEDK